MEDLSIKDAEGHSVKVTSLLSDDVDILNTLIGVVNNLSGSATATRNLDELVYSISPLSDSSLHLADGDTILSNGIYSRYYNKKLADYNKAPTVANARHIGALTNDNGVYSGFSSNKYLRLETPFNTGSNLWVAVFKVTTGSDVSTTQDIFDGQDISFVLRINNGYFRLFLASNDTSWDIADNLSGSVAVQANTTYWVKLAFTGSSYVFSYSLNGNDFTTDISVNSSLIIKQGIKAHIGNIQWQGEHGAPWLGSIDLTSSSITINNSLWWSGSTKQGFTNEAYWQSTINQFGACGRFVLDTTNGTLRLPKLTSFLEGTTNLYALGELVSAGLPGLKGQTTGVNAGAANGVTYGVFTQQHDEAGGVVATGSAAWRYYDSFDASKYNPIYGNSPTVQPQSISVYVYIVLASVIKTDVQVDIDNVATDLNGKASKSLDNITDSAKVMMAKAGMPSSRYVDLTVGDAGSTYRAPADGWFCLHSGAPSSGNSYVELTSSANEFGIVSAVTNQAVPLRIYQPCKKGDFVYLWYRDVSIAHWRFFYAEGSKNE